MLTKELNAGVPWFCKHARLHKETKTNKHTEPSPLRCILGWKSGQIALLVNIMCIWPFDAVPILFLEIIKWQHVACSSVPAQADCLDGSSKTYSIISLRNKQLQLLIYIWTAEDNSFSCFFLIMTWPCTQRIPVLWLLLWYFAAEQMDFIINHTFGNNWQNNPVKYFSDWESCIVRWTGEVNSKNVNFCYLGSWVGNTMCNTADEPSDVAVLDKFIYTLSNVVQQAHGVTQEVHWAQDLSCLADELLQEDKERRANEITQWWCKQCNNEERLWPLWSVWGCHWW